MMLTLKSTGKNQVPTGSFYENFINDVNPF